ncbi:hypothetical protein TNCT_230671 [Trichonephila clavata]|uniref:Uncharacterized protein n=1 Tax=Trichonephila clavata TaxID=2740835 RepID=A0A8X6HLB0_TRICU|nr:hypothetical protein TNCT_230671 [Trichonephila clavata]
MRTAQLDKTSWDKVDSAFKLLTSKDDEVAGVGPTHQDCRNRIRRQPTEGDLRSYLTGSMEGKFAETSNQLPNTWTLARKVANTSPGPSMKDSRP